MTMPPFSEAPPSPEHPFARVSGGDENVAPAPVTATRQTKDAPADIELSPKSVIDHLASLSKEPIPETPAWIRSLTQERAYQQWKKIPSFDTKEDNNVPKGILKRQSTSSSRTKKSVSFSSDSHSTRIIPNISIWTDPELAFSVWFSKPQFRDMKERCELLLDLLHHGIVEPFDYDDANEEYQQSSSSSNQVYHNQSVIQNEDYCSIGFESCFGQGREVAEALQIGGRAAVFLEQQTQFRDGYYCDELLRNGYMEFSERAESIARQRGENMAKAAGDWVYQNLSRETIQWMYTKQGLCEPLERLVTQQLAANSNSKR